MHRSTCLSLIGLLTLCTHLTAEPGVAGAAGDAAPKTAVVLLGTGTPNAEPDAQINSPVTDVFITEGDSVLFTATGMDPNGHYPLSFRWDFDGGAATSFVEDPGNVRFHNPGIYQVRLTVTDSEGLADSTPHRRTVTVSAAPTPPADTGGGGCAYAPGAGFDPGLLLLLGAGLALGRRRRRRGVRE